MSSAKFLLGNVVFGEKLQIDAKISNFDIFESALYMKSVSMPLITCYSLNITKWREFVKNFNDILLLPVYKENQLIWGMKNINRFCFAVVVVVVVAVDVVIVVVLFFFFWSIFLFGNIYISPCFELHNSLKPMRGPILSCWLDICVQTL